MGRLNETEGGDVRPEETQTRSATSVTDERGQEGEGGEGELFSPDERSELERRWNDIQARFVDEPRGSVEEANTLVEELMNRLVSSFSEQRARLEGQWDRGDDVSTEDLRMVLQRYRSFFGRLLELRVNP